MRFLKIVCLSCHYFIISKKKKKILFEKCKTIKFPKNDILKIKNYKNYKIDERAY